MKKEFEDYFSELQADMVAICLENVDGKADMIYIYIVHVRIICLPQDIFIK